MYEFVLLASVYFSHSLAAAAIVGMHTATRLLLLHHVLSGICLMFSAPIVATSGPTPLPRARMSEEEKAKAVQRGGRGRGEQAARAAGSHGEELLRRPRAGVSTTSVALLTLRLLSDFPSIGNNNRRITTIPPDGEDVFLLDRAELRSPVEGGEST